MKTLPRVSSGSCQNMTWKMNSYKLSSCEVMCASPFIRIHKHTCELSCSSEQAQAKWLYEFSGAKPNNTDSFLSFAFSMGIAGLKPTSSFTSRRVLSEKF